MLKEISFLSNLEAEKNGLTDKNIINLIKRYFFSKIILSYVPLC